MEARDLNFEVNTANELNKMLTGVLMDARRGTLDYNVIKSITLVADKINKNNVNILEYKKLSKHTKELEFFENDLTFAFSIK